uniref:UTP--glucose-1-phosphate uridylyltransferase n=1 Tax=Rhabditophanes sp. KR3021 TaxID=114890 RepID=A0AC35UEQ1_9BILA
MLTYNSGNVEDIMKKMDAKLSTLVFDETSQNDMKIFRGLFLQLLTEPSTINWNDMEKINPEKQIDYHNLPQIITAEEASHVLSKVAVLKLNGGLGTTMGCKGPKSLIPIKDNKTFLEFAVNQNDALNHKFNTTVPLYLLNSFNTEPETLSYQSARAGTLNFVSFNQSKCPRIYDGGEDNLMPVPWSAQDNNDEAEKWYPPGHGNALITLYNTGVLDKLLSEGREIVFISNIDNTGATLDINIAKAIVDGHADYIMEVTNKTPMDTKGGTLIDIKRSTLVDTLDGPRVEVNRSVMHLEMPQVPKDHVDDFCSMSEFKIFNTNNIWINLKVVKEKIHSMKMEIIVNRKKLSNGRGVIQLETSIGGAIRNFDNWLAVHVGRHRFLPVKKTQDIMAIMSNLYYYDADDYALRLRLDRPIPDRAPVIKLSSEFDSVAEFQRRIPHIPDMKDLLSLTVKGDVTFGKNVTLKASLNYNV